MSVNKEILIGKYLSGNASPAEVQKLNEWLKQDHANQEEFNRVEKLWSAALPLKKEKEADVEGAWSQFKALTEAQPEIRIRKAGYGWLRIAAAAALFIVLGVIVKVFFIPGAQSAQVSEIKAVKPAPEPVVVKVPDTTKVTVQDTATLPDPATASNQPVKSAKKSQSLRNSMITLVTHDSADAFMLPDRSIVYLNSNCKLQYPKNFSKANRQVILTGEAYFDVKKDTSQFIVKCNNTTTTSRNAAFNVKSEPGTKEVEVIVASGVVEFSGIGHKEVKKLSLKSGQSARYNKTKNELVRSAQQRKNYKWWEAKGLGAKIKGFFNRLFGKKH